MRLTARFLCLSAIAMLTATLSHASPDGDTPFATHQRYDVSGRILGTIGPDPDGSGPLGYPATRVFYDDRGRVFREEAGELLVWQSEDVVPEDWGSAFTVYATSETDYDEWGRPVRSFVLDGSDKKTATQTNYDDLGRVKCVAMRMNPAIFNSLPSDACALGSAGTQGADRIVKTDYDDFGRVTHLKKAVGTPLEQVYQTYTYRPTHKPESVTDAKGNKTYYTYDEFHRLYRTYFPSKTTTGQHNTADYEQYSYDDNGNVKDFRKRDGQTISYDYDAYNRVVVKDIPGGTSDDVYYAYDLRGLQTNASFESLTGVGINHAYDGFGRLEAAVNGQQNQTLGFSHDKNGNRTQLRHGSDYAIDFTHDGLDRLEGIGQAQNADLMFGTYHPRGHLKSTLRAGGGGAVSSLTVDGIGRLGTFTHDFSLTDSDLSVGFAYNPASQVVTRNISNAMFEHDLDFTGIEGDYAANGLNQYDTVAGQALTYDDNGNLTSDGERSYVYDVENRLTTISGSDTAALKYDPLGRLFETVINGVTTRFLYNGDALIAELDSSNYVLRRYVHGGRVDSPMVWFEGDDTSDARYYHTDHQGSIIAVSDVSGEVVDTTSYSPFGVPSSQISGRFAYTGQILLPGLDLYHYKARVYHPQLGRFLQTDPIGYQDQQNLYAYVGNDPVNNADPTGRCTKSANGSSVAATACFDAVNWARSTVEGHYRAASASPGSYVGGMYRTTLKRTLDLTNSFWGIESDVKSQLGPADNFSMAHGEVGGDAAIDTALLVASLGRSSMATGTAKASETLLARQAVAARNQLATDLKSFPGSSPATVTGGYNTVTGQVAARACGGGQCAEDLVVRALGGNSSNVRFTKAVRPRNGREVPVCERCQTKYDPSQFPEGTGFK